MQQPQGFVNKGQEHKVCKLRKALYELKQAPRAWYNKTHKFLLSEGFVITHIEPNLDVMQGKSQIIILVLYVDEIILTSSDEVIVVAIKSAFSQ